jgi:hypothetical protein
MRLVLRNLLGDSIFVKTKRYQMITKTNSESKMKLENGDNIVKILAFLAPYTYSFKTNSKEHIINYFPMKVFCYKSKEEKILSITNNNVKKIIGGTTCSGIYYEECVVGDVININVQRDGYFRTLNISKIVLSNLEYKQQLKQVASCTGCGLTNEYQDGPYLCYSCKHV